MKKLIALIALAFLFSCEKEECKTCTTVTTGSGYSNTMTFVACGRELKEVDGEVLTLKTTYGGVTITVTSKTTCK